MKENAAKFILSLFFPTRRAELLQFVSIFKKSSFLNLTKNNIPIEGM